jgi:hypothetical protein
MTMLVIKYGYMFRLFLSHPQANVVTEFRYIKCAPNRIPLRLKICLQTDNYSIILIEYNGLDPIKHSVSVIKTNQLNLSRELMAITFEVHVKHKNFV